MQENANTKQQETLVISLVWFAVSNIPSQYLNRRRELSFRMEQRGQKGF